MVVHYDELHSQGIRVRVLETKDRGPFRADISCGVTGANLGGAEKCKSLEEAIERGKKHARKFTY